MREQQKNWLKRLDEAKLGTKTRHRGLRNLMITPQLYIVS